MEKIIPNYCRLCGRLYHYCRCMTKEVPPHMESTYAEIFRGFDMPQKTGSALVSDVIDAEEARKRSDNVNQEIDENIKRDIMIEINKAIQQGEFRVTIDSNLSEPIIKWLTDLGYQVSPADRTYIIIWS